MNSLFSIYEISALSALLPIFSGLYWRKYLTIDLKLILLFSLASLTTDIIAYFLGLNGMNNLFLINIFLPIQTILLGLFFLVLPNYKGGVKLATRFIFIISSFSSLILFFLNDLYEKIHVEQLVISSLAVLIYSLIYFYNLVINELDIPLWLEPKFYIITGLLLYFVSTSALYLSFYNLEHNPSQNLWTFKLLGYIFLNFLFVIGFLVNKKKNSHG